MVSLLTVGDPQTTTGGYLYHARMARLAPSHQARIDFFSFPRRPFPWAVLSQRGLRAALAEKPDVLLVDSIALPFAAPWLRPTAGRVPVAVISHQPPGGIDRSGWRRTGQAALDRVGYRRADLVLVASAALAAELLAAGVPGGRLRVAPPGRDPAEPAAGRPVELRQGRRMSVLAVGNWLPRKGITELLAAVARLPPDVLTLHLVGDDRVDRRYARRVRRRVSSAALRDRVVLYGRLPADRVARLYRAADVFALASTREPYGTVYGEAMAAGLPVVGWDAGNLPHLAAHGREGLLAPTGDVAGLAAALGRLAGDPALRQRMGRAAAARAAGLPTWAQTAARFFAALRELVADRSPAERSAAAAGDPTAG